MKLSELIARFLKDGKRNPPVPIRRLPYAEARQESRKGAQSGKR